MAFAAAAVIVPVGVLFFISGLVTNAIQATCYVVIRPFSKSTYRRINRLFAELLWLELVWLIDWWAGVKVQLYTDPETFKLMGKEHALLISNHRSDIDWVVGWVLAQGFVTAVNHMRSFVPAIYEVTVAIPKSSPAPTMLRIFKGQPSVVHIHLKRHMMKDLPENDDDIAQWCRDVFVAKDKLLDKHIAEDSFGEEQLQNIGRPVKSLVVVVSWACLLIVGAIKLFQSSALLSSWKGITVSATLLAVITILMQILINFTQSERSTPAKVAPAKRQNGKKVVVENGQ
ncbi:1-acyl-sn-glycerol-3-phosphate acyltransferase 2-like [Ipomoea triloba]|uniref:1-acyl-sn-glycerol-3-phosphate acyltransferase 2-like n=1 Tax=Ipomoea triloba TaxID=35885 RepID=UPI00125DD17D|nr:1-acyl-sn-glycerol-3-phosphate acyltransferase 2-like [Ipomoea triloba]